MDQLFFIKYRIREVAGRFEALAIVGGALLLNGCILPPKDSNAPSGGGGGGGAVKPTEDRYVFWDGEGAGAAAKGWSDCDKKPGCKGTVEQAPKKGKGDSMGLRFHGEGPGWIGLGWNFLGWWPEDGGTDVSGYSKLTFSIKVVAASEEEAPDLSAVQVGLRCSKGKKDSNAVSIKNYVPELLNGEWHDVAIPLGEFAKEDFDPGTVWELNLSTWSGNPKKFDIYLDDIAVEK